VGWPLGFNSNMKSLLFSMRKGVGFQVRGRFIIALFQHLVDCHFRYSHLSSLEGFVKQNRLILALRPKSPLENCRLLGETMHIGAWLPTGEFILFVPSVIAPLGPRELCSITNTENHSSPSSSRISRMAERLISPKGSSSLKLRSASKRRASTLSRPSVVLTACLGG
jgi:hypothetical protein